MSILQFRVLPEHIMLLQHAYVRWNNCETGAPCIDPKRPYGNSSVIPDIAEILNKAFDEEDYDNETADYLFKLHKETEQVLEIFLQTGVMMPGLYQRDNNNYHSKWQWVHS